MKHAHLSGTCGVGPISYRSAAGHVLSFTPTEKHDFFDVAPHLGLRDHSDGAHTGDQRERTQWTPEAPPTW